MVLNKKGPTKRSRASFHTWCPYVTTMIDVEATLKQLVNRQLVNIIIVIIIIIIIIIFVIFIIII